MENNLGKRAKDKVSGFEGIITAHATYLHGSDRVELTAIPSGKSNKAPESIWLEAERVQVAAKYTPRKTTKA